MTMENFEQMVNALFKKLDRIEQKVDSAQGQNAENYRIISVIEQRTASNEARIKQLELENEAAEAHQKLCAEHRGRCPGPEFQAVKKMIWGAMISALSAAVVAAVAIMNTGGR